jgi:hypothetical protein
VRSIAVAAAPPWASTESSLQCRGGEVGGGCRPRARARGGEQMHPEVDVPDVAPPRSKLRYAGRMRLGCLAVIVVMLTVGEAGARADDPAWYCTSNTEYDSVAFCDRSHAMCNAARQIAPDRFDPSMTPCEPQARAVCITSREIVKNSTIEECFPTVTICERMQARIRQDHERDRVTDCVTQGPDDAANHARLVFYGKIAGAVAVVLAVLALAFRRARRRRLAARGAT